MIKTHLRFKSKTTLDLLNFIVWKPLLHHMVLLLLGQNLQDQSPHQILWHFWNLVQPIYASANLGLATDHYVMVYSAIVP